MAPNRKHNIMKQDEYPKEVVPQHSSRNLISPMVNSGGFILSGCFQPILMTICKNAGLGDPIAQVYMFFYALGPALVVFPLLWERDSWPHKVLIWKAVGITLFDIIATCINYAGAAKAGPTIFSIVYSSVTVWTAIYSQLFLGRSMNGWQWAAVLTVFGGLTITAIDSLQLGGDVVEGLFMVIIGSALHALTYVMCEAVMTVGEDKLSVKQNCAIQATAATILFFIWQIVYTVPRFEETIWAPMQAAETSVSRAFIVLGLFAFVSLIHTVTFYETLLLPGGSTTSGVMKGLQAVLVFVFTHWAFCGRTGGDEMCFTMSKFFSLITVAGGVMCYGAATQKHRRWDSRGNSRGYERIDDQFGIEIEPFP